MMGGQIRILRETRLEPDFPLSRQELVRVVETILECLGLVGASLELTLVGDREIARLNSEFMGCPGPTNILSFPASERFYSDSGDTAKYLGELALSVDALAREAHLYGQPPLVHLARLLAHGILHLAGYDHGEEMDTLTETAVDVVQLTCPG